MESSHKYLALVDMLERGIAEGRWRAGDRLPSNREMGAMFSVTVGTVSKAMAEAVRRGLVEARVGSGTYVRAARRADPEPLANGVVDLALNTLPTGVVEDVLDAALDRRGQGGVAGALFSCSPSYDAARDRALGARWLGRLGTPVAPEDVLLTTGVHQGLVAAFHALLKPGARAVCEALTYTGTRRIAESRGVTLVGVAGDEHGLLPDAVDRALADTDARVLVVTTTLQNPTAASLTLERREQLTAVCRSRDAHVIEDGVHIPLAGDELPSLAALMPERTIHLTGFSKCIASGFRLGYASMPPAMRSAFHEALTAAQWIGPGFFAELVATMYADGAVERCIARHRAEAAHRQALVRSHFPGAHAGSSPCYHAWIEAPAGGSAHDLCLDAANVGVKVSPGQHFAVDPAAPTPAGVRVSLGACGRAELARALEKLAACWRRLQGSPTTRAPLV